MDGEVSAPSASLVSSRLKQNLAPCRSPSHSTLSYRLLPLSERARLSNEIVPGSNFIGNIVLTTCHPLIPLALNRG